MKNKEEINIKFAELHKQKSLSFVRRLKIPDHYFHGPIPMNTQRTFITDFAVCPCGMYIILCEVCHMVCKVSFGRYAIWYVQYAL